ncbi:MAG: TolC family protein [Candidatus Cloacimonadaceae bacterium]|nr:TolC family protein [Candidatus Cloacimonadaceae bacterium]
MKRFIIIILLMPLTLLAAQYTLDDLIQYGLNNSWTMQRTELNYQISESQLSSSKWNLLPDASVGLSFENNLYHRIVPPVSDLSGRLGFTISKTISINDPAWFNYKYASLDNSRAKLQAKRSAGTYAYQVFGAYLEVLSAGKQLASLTENLGIQTRVWEQGKVLLQLGKTTPFDVKQNEIAVMNSRILIIQLENTIATNRARLFGLVQMTDEGFELADLEPNPTFALPVLDTEEIGEVKILEADIKRSELGLTQDFRDYFPRVSLAYNFARNIGGENFNFDKYSTSHTVSLNLSYSLWNQFKQHQIHKRSRISNRLAEISLLDKKDEIKRQYNITAQELAYQNRLNELYGEKLEQSREQIRIAEERYRLGLIQLLELDKTRTDYIDANIAYHTNRYQIIAKQEALNYLLSNKILGKW